MRLLICSRGWKKKRGRERERERVLISYRAASKSGRINWRVVKYVSIRSVSKMESFEHARTRNSDAFPSSVSFRLLIRRQRTSERSVKIRTTKGDD